MKLIGCMMILIAGIGMGIGRIEGINLRVKELRELRKMLLMLCHEMNGRHFCMNDAIRQILPRILPVYREFMQEICNKIEEKDGKLFREYWENSIRRWKGGTLKQKERERLITFGNELANTDSEQQERLFSIYVEELEVQIREEEEERKEKGRLQMCLCISAALVIIILLQ